ncbi:hypothetical protein GCM10023197_31750 [Gordonia humi]|uniref:histidine phosphatase family protein n=1 Tax=Gordonia humi TaxID=686429 RepID=UPI00336DB416
MGPELSVVSTAAALGVAVEPDPSLASLDIGRWRGRAPEDVAADLPVWFADPDACPHGGESIRAFVARIGAAVDDGDQVIVASPVAQALLCADADRYFAVEVRPASVFDCR